MSADTAPALSPGVQKLLLEHIDSYVQLRALLVLKEQEGESCQTGMIARRANLSEDDVAEALRSLCKKGLAVDDSRLVPRFRYLAQSSEVDALVNELAGCYESQQLQLLREMTANALERLRAGAAVYFEAYLGGAKRAPSPR